MQDKKDLTEHIAERLRSHEENYEQGAWENFVQYEKKKKKTLPLFWIAAACLIVLLGAGIFYYMNDKNSNQNNNIALNNSNIAQPHNADNVPTPKIKDSIVANTISSNNQLAQHNGSSVIGSFSYSPQHKVSDNNSYLSNSISIDSIKSTSNSAYSNITTNSNKQIAANNNVQTKQYQNQNTAVQNNSDSGKLSYFPNDVLTFDDEDNKSNNSSQHWTADVVLTPSVSNNSNKLNMGYGVSVGYKVSKKVSVNSGLSYTQLTGYNSNGTGTSGVQSIQANVTGLNIPLEIRYHINSKFYVNAGASALAVLSNKQQINYVVSNVVSDAFTSNNGNTLKSSSILAEPVMKASENIPQSQVGNQNIAGFFNFSVGLKQKLGAKTNFAIEPFISVPMNNNFGTQNIHLINEGVRIKIGL
ncbi:MAG TPA: hypothetical protein VGB84_02605 [Arachidicoccus sp.]